MALLLYLHQNIRACVAQLDYDVMVHKHGGPLMRVREPLHRNCNELSLSRIPPSTRRGGNALGIECHDEFVGLVLRAGDREVVRGGVDDPQSTG